MTGQRGWDLRVRDEEGGWRGKYCVRGSWLPDKESLAGLLGQVRREARSEPVPERPLTGTYTSRPGTGPEDHRKRPRAVLRAQVRSEGAQAAQEAGSA